MAVLTFAEDYSNNTTLDSGLISTPGSGLFWNRGVHPLITKKNLLDFLPIVSYTFSGYAAGTTYGKYEDTGLLSDVVLNGSVYYFSKTSSNTGNALDNTTYWQETNMDSLRLRHFIANSKANLITALLINRKLIENQYIYNLGREFGDGDPFIDLEGDYSGWIFEPKGSDYVKIRINQMSLQANTTNPVTVSVLNQGQLVSTFQLTPNNGVLSFEDVGYTISGVGRFHFVFPSQEVRSLGAFNDPLKYKGFVCYPIIGTGSTPAGSTYSRTSAGNGLNFNLSAYLDSSVYVTNNLIDLAKLWQLQFQIDALKLFSYNPQGRVHADAKRIRSNQSENLLAMETLNVQDLTIANEYKSEVKRCRESIDATFDNFLKVKKGFKVKRTVL